MYHKISLKCLFLYKNSPLFSIFLFNLLWNIQIFLKICIHFDFICRDICINISTPHAYSAHGGQTRALDPLELEFGAWWIGTVWVLGTSCKPGSSGQAVSALKYGTISPDLKCTDLKGTVEVFCQVYNIYFYIYVFMYISIYRSLPSHPKILRSLSTYAHYAALFWTAQI